MFVDKNALQKTLMHRDVKDVLSLNKLLAEMSKEVIETLVEGELTSYLGYAKHDQGIKETENRRNGHRSKKIKSQFGEIPIKTPRDRESGFEPQLIKKNQRNICGLEDKIISLYGIGMSTRDIRSHIKEIYGYSISPETISTITDHILDRAKEWQSRPLDEVYAVIFMDAMFVKAKVDSVIKDVAINTLLGIKMNGVKECLGVWINGQESAKYWLNVMNDIKSRGVKEVLIFAVDNLAGISQAIKAVFPGAEIQKCVIHQIRNSTKHVSQKDLKSLMNDIRSIYKASTLDQASSALGKLEENWASKYPHLVKSWRTNWPELSTFFNFPHELRRLIYTTNPIESLHRSIRKIFKTKAIMPGKNAVLKLAYMAITSASQKWTSPMNNWSKIYPQLRIYFEERLDPYMK